MVAVALCRASDQVNLVSPKDAIGLKSISASKFWNRPMGVIKSPAVRFLEDSVKKINLFKETYPEVTEFKEDAAYFLGMKMVLFIIRRNLASDAGLHRLSISGKVTCTEVKKIS
uniref:Uncharacterized protein n=1 Tax=Oryza sativa subsp. japonica TaxID=39947 RepID=Q6Z984_ORYSJ|nr:hypothetical protein [Oryza sativa Japonica Group]BAD03381.1 hypothetical protein [Oryza sativa Japonica Group]